MTTTVVRRTATAALAGLFLAVGAAVAVAPAHADPVYDQQFIDRLDKKGVPYKNRTEAIRTAKQFCIDTTRQGNPDWLAGYKLGVNQGWTQTETNNFIGAAVPTYCPQLWE